jgi:DNA-binding NtrC family response regulator
MSDERQEGNVSFIEFSDAAANARASPALIATFPHPAGSSRVRAAQAAKAIDSGELIGESPEMIDVAEQLRRVAPSQATVMLVGESGTGKELAAQFLHARSPRSSGPMVAVNCGAIPANLVEAELFGYERGAFTGAVRQHPGYFERATGGTLLLDEITEMPLDLQPKLLRVLETGRTVRVGGTEEIAVDVRIVTATNHPPEAILRDRRLREDLFYRLAVFVVRLPPLRRRGDDIELLAHAFLERLNAQYGTRKRFDPRALAIARTHRWPGNVRELRNCVERSFVLCDDVVALDLQPIRQSAFAGIERHESVQIPIGTTLADAEHEVLLATLKHCGGNKRRTAEMLGVSVKTVYNKLVERRARSTSAEAGSASARKGAAGRLPPLIPTSAIS